MILKRTDKGCPQNTYDVIHRKDWEDLSFCLCEDHCSWNGCNLEDPPLNCLLENESTWLWDSRKQFWIAGLLPGINESMHSIIKLQCSNIKYDY